MKTPQEVFDSLQAEFGDYGKYVLLQNPYQFDKNLYKAGAVTLKSISSSQQNDYVDDEGFPDDPDYTLIWDTINTDYEDESDACDWSKYSAYDSFGNYIESGEYDYDV